ncbi:hypothetical protein KCP69_17810 [Salmonella enterica subsp. enterica]|nr:hypothetical protein KCP69_17810 [Salmonella enterica subsp. enterica]
MRAVAGLLPQNHLLLARQPRRFPHAAALPDWKNRHGMLMSLKRLSKFRDTFSSGRL